MLQNALNEVKGFFANLAHLGIYPNASKQILDAAKSIEIADCVQLDGGDLFTDVVGRQIGASGFVKFSSPVNFDPTRGVHTLDPVKTGGTRSVPGTKFNRFGWTDPVKAGKKSVPLGRRNKAAEEAFMPAGYLLPNQPTMFDVLAYVVMPEGAVLFAIPGDISERWPGVVKTERVTLK